MENNLSISQSIRFNIDFYFVKYPEVNELMAIPFLPVTVDMAQSLSKVKCQIKVTLNLNAGTMGHESLLWLDN